MKFLFLEKSCGRSCVVEKQVRGSIVFLATLGLILVSCASSNESNDKYLDKLNRYPMINRPTFTSNDEETTYYETRVILRKWLNQPRKVYISSIVGKNNASQIEVDLKDFPLETIDRSPKKIFETRYESLAESSDGNQYTNGYLLTDGALKGKYAIVEIDGDYKSMIIVDGDFDIITGTDRLAETKYEDMISDEPEKIMKQQPLMYYLTQKNKFCKDNHVKCFQ